MHDDTSPMGILVHGNLTTSNIIITEEFAVAKVGGIGLVAALGGLRHRFCRARTLPYRRELPRYRQAVERQKRHLQASIKSICIHRAGGPDLSVNIRSLRFFPILLLVVVLEFRCRCVHTSVCLSSVCQFGWLMPVWLDG